MRCAAKEYFEAGTKAGIALIVQVKVNQPTLHQQIREVCAAMAPLGSAYSRDATLGEDRSRIRTNPGVFARLHSFAFNLLKANRTDTLSQDGSRADLAGIDNLLEMPAIPER